MPKQLLVALACACLALPALAEKLPDSVRDALQAAQIPLSSVAVVVQPVTASRPLIAHNATQPMNPASVMKLLTTYAALDLLGPAWTWRTSALVDRPPVAGRLDGNLYLQGSGDPHFTIDQLTALLRQLRVRGIRHIAGDVVIDRSAFAVPASAPGAFDDKPMRPYNVGADGLLINFRALAFSLQAADGQPRLLQETPSAGLRLDNRLQTSNAPCDRDWKERIGIRLIPETGGERLEFTGDYSRQCGDKTLNLAPLTADAQVDGLFRALWQELGGTLAGRVRPGLTPPDRLAIASQESPPLADTIRQINKFSNNVMARQLYLTLGRAAPAPVADAAEPPDAPPATAERARQRLTDWLAGRQLRFAELTVDNGSGLSRLARISAGSLNRLLLDAWRSPLMPEFVSSLPIAGIDGTMKKRLADTDAGGRAHIKTGTLDGVKTAAGYALDATGQPYAVSFLINHPRARAGTAAIDALLVWIAERKGRAE